MRLSKRIFAMFRRENLDAEMSEEMRLHIEQRVEDNIKAGMSPTEARHAALRRFGGIEQTKETARAQRNWVWLEAFLKDVRYATRALRKSPGFTVTVLLIL